MTEQNIINLLFFILRDLYGNFAYIFFISSILTPKHNKFFTVLILGTGMLVLYYLVNDLDSAIGIVCIFTTVTVACLTLYKEKKTVCLLAAAIFFAVITLSDMIGAIIILDIYGYYPTKNEIPNWDSISCTILIDIQMIIHMYISYLIWIKLFLRKNIKSMAMFILFPFSQTFFIMAFAKGTYSNNILYAFDSPLLIIAIIISVFADITMYFALRDNSNMNNMRQRLSEIENEMNQQLKYYDAISDQYTEIREYRHDILNLVSAAEIMLNNNLSKQESEKYIQEMKEKAEALEVPIFCNNPLVNAVLWQKQQTAEKYGIDITVDIEPSENFPIDRIDVCSLMVNLMDNALRGCENCDNPHIYVSASRKLNMLFIEVENSCPTSEKSSSRKIATTKDGDHGHGMDIINKIAEKYKGEFLFTSENVTAKAAVELTV